MKVFVLGLDGATWDVLDPLFDLGLLPNLCPAAKPRCMWKSAIGVPAA